MKYYMFVLLMLLTICFMAWRKHYEVKFAMGWERTGFMILKGGYRAWWIRYSDGILMSSPPKVLWCFPRFEHCDVRPFLKNLDMKDSLYESNR